MEDTISNCSGFYEVWVQVIKDYNNQCIPEIGDSLYSNYGLDCVKIIDNSNGCDNTYYNSSYFNGGCCSGSNCMGTYPANYIAFKGFQKPIDTWYYAITTIPHNFDKSKNYSTCSANFEFSVVSQDCTGQRLLFKAMNKKASSYKWLFTGFGDPIIATNDTASLWYIGPTCECKYYVIPPVILITSESSGCKDTLLQNIALINSSLTVVGLESNELDEINLQVYPNPVKDKFTIDYSGNLVLSGTITDVLGQEIKRIPSIKEKQEIDLGAFSSGAYFINVQSSNARRTFKLLKQ